MQQPTFPSPADDKLEALLSSHLHATLDPQRGRALDAFDAHLAGQDAPIPISRGVVPRRALWYWAGVPSLVAASLAVVLTLQMVQPPTVITPNPGATGVSVAGMGGDAPSANPPRGTIIFDQVETTHDLAGGIAVLPDNTPVRLIHRQGTRQTQWIDPRDNATYKMTEEPIENVGYTQIQPF